MAVTQKQAGITFLVVLVVGTILFLYTASRVIIFTKHFTSDIEVSRGETSVASDDVYATLNRMEEIRLHPNNCPDRMGSCSSQDGYITLVGAKTPGNKKRLRLSTEELGNVWAPPADSARHDAFVERVVEAFRSEGYVVEEVGE
mgnify:CR=1 FL=1